MPTDRFELRRAVHSILNDVVEQCFHHLIHHPQHAEAINRIIREASDEINYQSLKIDAHALRPGSKDLDDHYAVISRDTHKKSLEMLSRLQRIQREKTVSDDGERPAGSSSPFQSF